MLREKDVTAFRMQHAVYKIALAEDTRAHAGADREIDHVFDAPGDAEGGLAGDGTVHVRVKADGYAQIREISHDIAVLPRELRGCRNVAVGRRVLLEIQRPETGNAQAVDLMILKEFMHRRQGLRRCQRRCGHSLVNVSILIADRADHLGSARLNSS